MSTTTKTTLKDRYEALSDPDTDNHTYIDHTDVPDSEHWEADYRYRHKPTHYQHLDGLNSGRIIGGNWHNQRVITDEIAEHEINALTQQLDLPESQQRWAESLYMDLDRQRVGMSSQTIAFCLCALVVEQDSMTERRTHPNVPEEKFDDTFQRIAEGLDIDGDQIATTYGKLEALLDIS
jgi:hypothetical protein